LYVSEELRDRIASAEHVHRVRTDGISDHAILVAELAVGDPQASASSAMSEHSEAESPTRRPPVYEDGWGELVRAYRMYLGMSQRCLAERLSMSERSLADIEVGRRPCPPGFMDSIKAVVDDFDGDVEKIIRSVIESRAAQPLKQEPISVEVTDEIGREWDRTVIGRAAVRSGLLIPVRPLGAKE